MRIKQFSMFCLLLLLPLVVAFAQREEGVLTDQVVGSKAMPWENAMRSGADFYDMKPLHGAVDTGWLTLSTKWDSTRTHLCKAVYNNSGSLLTLKVITNTSPTPSATDTVRFKIYPYSISPKLPILAKIKLSLTDSVIIFFQILR